MTNICYNCLDRNIESGNGDKIAIYWEGNEPGLDSSLTYNQLLARVCQVCFCIFFYCSSYKAYILYFRLYNSVQKYGTNF